MTQQAMSTDTAVSSKRLAGLQAGDIWGGMAAAAVILPQAMAFGVALLVPLGLDAGTGALTGLVAAAALSLASGLLGGTRGLISAPTGPTLVLVSGSLATLAAAGLAGPDLLTGLVALMVVTGFFQALIGLSGGGRLITFIPYPVVAGFMTGSAILMVKSQLAPVSGVGFDAVWANWRWVPAVVAIATYALMRYLPRVLPMLPGTVAGLLGGTLIFQLIVAFGPAGVPEAWVIGQLPGPAEMHIGIAWSALPELPWIQIATAGLALAVLASLDTLLTAVIADVETGARHQARRELLGQGIGQILSGLLGGMSGAGTTGATVVAVKTGGRRWVGCITGLSFALLVAFAGPVGHLLPISALAGIIICVAVGMLEWDIFAWAKRQHTRADAGIAILVTTVTVAYDLMAAVGVGVLIAVFIFIREQVKAPVIHRHSDATQVRSVRHRTNEQRALLDKHGDRIIIYELRGSLFFATADRLFSELLPDLDRPAWVILKMRRVSQVDLTGIKILQQIATRLEAHGGHLLFSNVHKAMGLGRKVQKTLIKISPKQADSGVRTFNDADEALDWAENALLEELGAPLQRGDVRIELADMDLCQGMRADEIASLESVLRSRQFAAKESLVEAGERGEELFLVVTGEIDIRLPTTRHHYMRLAKFGAGTLFGEVAFLDPGPRTASAVGVLPGEVLILDQAGFEQLRQLHPGAAIAVLKSLGKALGDHLRWSTVEMYRLAQW